MRATRWPPASRWNCRKICHHGSYQPNLSSFTTAESLVDVHEAIKDVFAEFGIKALRADDIEHQDRITDVILNQIVRSELLYGVPTYRLNEAVKRNRKRFPADFMFRLSEKEAESLTSQFAISKKGRGGRRTLPYAFTEQGVAMLSSVLNSERAIQVNIAICEHL